MQAGMDSDVFLTPLQRERSAHGWTQQEAIDRLKRLARERGHGHRFDGLEINTLSRYEHGRICRPRAPLPELFAALYEVPVERLFPQPAQKRPTLTLLPAISNAIPTQNAHPSHRLSRWT